MEAAPAVQAQVRVDQVGYADNASKRAYLMTSAAAAGAVFRVTDAHGDIAYASRVGADQGSWSSTYDHVYALDFNGVRSAGSFHIVVIDGSLQVRSPAFRIDSPARIYAAAMANSLSFYQNERDGPDFIPSALRTAPAHLNDANAMTYLIPEVDSNGNFKGDLTALGQTIDAAGGWWDAGDYLKFTETISYVVAMMETDVRDFPDQLGPGSATANYSAEAAFGLNWLEHMWNDSTKTLYLQVGIGAGNSTDRQRPRHLAAASGRRHVRRDQSARIGTSGTGRCSAPERPDRSSVRTSPGVSRPTSLSAISSIA